MPDEIPVKEKAGANNWRSLLIDTMTHNNITNNSNYN